MSAEQWEIAFVACGLLVATLDGRGWIDIGMPASTRAKMRWAAPIGLIGLLLALAYSFWQ
jgi:hypothetical protein